MRNLFDQYSQPENQLSHALACCLNEDSRLRSRFVKWATGERLNGRFIKIVEQQVPGDEWEDQDDATGLPDVWLYTDDGWALLIESKVAAKAGASQLRKHQATAIRAKFEKPHILLLTPSPIRVELPSFVTHREWSELYELLRDRRLQSAWATRLSNYLEAIETRWSGKGYHMNGTLTRFDGFKVDDENPYNYREAKRLLRLAMEELKKRPDLKRLIDPASTGRGKITGTGGSSVWDFISLRGAHGHEFTRFPHLTLGVHRDLVGASVTIPNSVRRSIRGKLLGDNFDDFESVICSISSNFHKEFGKLPEGIPILYALQRHYKSQSSPGVEDARLWLDLRTAFRQRGSKVKAQPQWLRAIYDVMSQKRSNIQFGIGMEFRYGTAGLDKRIALDLIAQSWLCCRPLLDDVVRLTASFGRVSMHDRGDITESIRRMANLRRHTHTQLKLKLGRKWR
ncbi:MAG TPA: hypothetical protein VHD56_16905 [Tepidisphaeraceae bacterium]|nr:hypothetical protein [Tepidisphaeraceae bacterium]